MIVYSTLILRAIVSKIQKYKIYILHKYRNRVRDRTSGLKFVAKGFMGFYMTTLTILQLSRTKDRLPFHIHKALLILSLLAFMYTVLASWVMVLMYPRYPQHRPRLEKLFYTVYSSAVFSSVVLRFVSFHP